MPPPEHPRQGRQNGQNPCESFQQHFPGVETELGLGWVESWPPLSHCGDFGSLRRAQRVGTSCREEVTSSRTRCLQLSVGLEGDSGHELFAVGATLMDLILFLHQVPLGEDRESCVLVAELW